MAWRLGSLRRPKGRRLALLLTLVAGPAGAADPFGEPTHFVTPWESVPNFARNPTLRSAQSGPWSSASTWMPARLPVPTDVVRVEHLVVYDSPTGVAGVVGVDAGGVLRFATDRSTRLATGVLLVMPGGTLEVGTPAAPLPAGHTAEIVIRNLPLDPIADPDQFGTGLLAVNGRVTMHGAVRSPSFVRLATAPGAGATSLALDQAVSGWRVGDRILLPDSAQPRTEDSGVPRSYDEEVRTIGSVAPDGRSLGFAAPLGVAHPGTTDENADGRADFRPHVANLDRNVVVRSESRGGTRGHVFVTWRSAVDVRYAAFVDLGRTRFEDLDPVTNRVGRYFVHLHHLMGPFPPTDPQYQFRLVGNVVRDDGGPAPPPQKWGIAVHDSHYGLLRDNVVFNVGGAAFVTEDGSESFNLFERNFAAHVLGNGGRSEVDEDGRGVAREGVGFWFRGPNNSVRDNVATNMIEGEGEIEAAYGFKYNFTYLGDVRIPDFRGADTSVDGEFTEVAGNGLALREFDGNEAYGLIQGFTLWWLCTLDFTPVEGCPPSVVRDLVVWHTARYAYYGYPGYNYTFDGTKVYGDPAIAAGNNHEFKSVFFFGDYGTTDLLVTRAAFYNTIGLNPPYFRDGSIRVEDSFFKTRAGIIHRKSGAPGSCPTCDLPDPDTVVANNRFAPVGGHPLRTISLDDESTDPENEDRLFVCAHDGQVGDDFEVYFPSQGNAPCTDTRPDVADGYVCVTPEVAAVCGTLFFDGFETGDTSRWSAAVP